MPDDLSQETLHRQHSKLRVLLITVSDRRNVSESEVRTYHDVLNVLSASDMDVKDWYVPNALLRGITSRVSNGLGDWTTQERTVSRSKFDLYAVPAFEALGRELNRRTSNQHAASPSTSSPLPDSAEVWVVYGRNEEFRRTIFHLLRDIGLQPIEFNKAIVRSGYGSPNVIDVVLKEIATAPAIVCLLTPDDHAELRIELRPAPRDDAKLNDSTDGGYQPRPNVLLETGMALAAMRHRTIIVSMGHMREISDLSGLHEVRWRNAPEVRIDLVNRLEAIGCPVDRLGVDWMT